MTVINENGQWIERGPWLPTNYLCMRNGVLMQKMRRRVKHYLHSQTGRGFGAGCGRTYEYEWQSIPELKE